MTHAVRERELPVAPAPHSPSTADAPRSRLSGRRLLWVAAGLVVLQLAVRSWVAFDGYFFADDLILEGRAASLPLWSAEYLFYDHDGHFMPGSFLLAGVITRLAPLQWWAPALSLVLLQALASLAVLRLVRLVIGDRPLLLLPLTFYLFTPLTLPSFAWWAAGVNALPLQIGLAWVAGDAVRLVRTGRQRYAVTGTAVVALAVACFVKAVIVPWFAFAVVVLLARAAGEPAPIREALRRGQALWLGSAVVTGVWAWAYTTFVRSPVVDAPIHPADVATMVGNGLARGLTPALLGGPWTWSGTQAVPPWAGPPLVLAAASCVGALVVVFASCRRRQGAWLVWALVAAHVAVSATLMILGRFDPSVIDLLPLSLRHFSDAAVVVAVAIALILRAPARPRSPDPLLTRRGLRVLVPAVAVVFMASSVWTTAAFMQLWSEKPAEAYLATARESLAGATDAPLLDQPVADNVLWNAAYPHNLASHVFAPLDQRPGFAPWTWNLRTIDDSGRVVPARVVPSASIAPGPQPDCGHHVSSDAVTEAPLDTDVYGWTWTLRLDYLASRDGDLQVSLATGEAVHVSVVRGLHSVYVQLEGGGANLRLSTTTRDLAVCVGGGVVGLVGSSG